MTFDPSQPTNTTKIRLLGQVIRPNWLAIEQATSSFRPYAINLRDRTVAPPGIPDPTAISSPDAIILFCKQDATPTQEFYLRYPNGNITKLTEAGTVGSHTTPLRGSSISLDSSTPILLHTSAYMIVAHGSFNSAGVAIGTNLNLTCTYDGTGKYIVHVAAGILANSNYRVLSTPFNSGGGNIRAVQITSKGSGVITAVTDINLNIKGHTNSPHDCGFEIVIMGGR